jgi:hypothetical protein
LTSFGNLKRRKKMQFILIKQIAVEAATPEEAATKEGKTISLQVQPRPQQTQSTVTRQIQGTSQQQPQPQ